MKIALYVWTAIGFLALLISCVQTTSESRRSAIEDSMKVDLDKIKKELLNERRENIEEQARIDSLRYKKVLEGALEVASGSIHKNKFYDKYEVILDSVVVNVVISLDYHFTEQSLI